MKIGILFLILSVATSCAQFAKPLKDAYLENALNANNQNITNANTITVGNVTVTNLAATSGTITNLTATNFVGTPVWPDNVRQTFNPGATNAGINVGAHTADPASPSNGDAWYNSTSNEFKIRANGTTITIGSTAGLAPDSATYITKTANGTLTNEFALSTLSTGLLSVTTGTGDLASVTTSAGLFSLISDETGTSGGLVRATGAAIDPTSIGAVTRGTGRFTTLDSSVTTDAASAVTITSSVAALATNPLLLVNATNSLYDGPLIRAQAGGLIMFDVTSYGVVQLGKGLGVNGGAAGSLELTGGTSADGGNAGGNGGSLQLKGGAVLGANPGGAGGTIQMNGGPGGGAAGKDAGYIQINAGSGSDPEATGGNAGEAGSIEMNGGIAGTGGGISEAAGSAGAIRMNGGNGAFVDGGTNAFGGDSGSLLLNGGNGNANGFGLGGSGGSGGNIYLYGGDGSTLNGSNGGAGGIFIAYGGNGSTNGGIGYLGGNGGRITMTGGTAVGANGGNAGIWQASATGQYDGGSINMTSNGSVNAGSFSTVAGGSLTMGTASLTGPNTGTGTTIMATGATQTVTATTFNTQTGTNTLQTIDELHFTNPHQVDGTGAVLNTTSTSPTYGHATFSNSTAAANNFVLYRIRVPFDLDTSVDLQAQFTFRLAGADTNTHRYIISMANVASSASADSPTFINAINLDKSDASGAANDIETTAYTTLTSWRTSLTAGNILVIKLARDGNSGTDTSTVDSSDVELSIKYGRTQ